MSLFILFAYVHETTFVNYLEMHLANSKQFTKRTVISFLKTTVLPKFFLHNFSCCHWLSIYFFDTGLKTNLRLLMT